jgi:hypothetical protein
MEYVGKFKCWGMTMTYKVDVANVGIPKDYISDFPVMIHLKYI